MHFYKTSIGKSNNYIKLLIKVILFFTFFCYPNNVKSN